MSKKTSLAPAGTEQVLFSDKKLLDWLSRRAYVEATSRGFEDPKRFEFHGGDLRRALTRHIIRCRPDKT